MWILNESPESLGVFYICTLKKHTSVLSWMSRSLHWGFQMIIKTNGWASYMTSYNQFVTGLCGSTFINPICYFCVFKASFCLSRSECLKQLPCLQRPWSWLHMILILLSQLLAISGNYSKRSWYILICYFLQVIWVYCKILNKRPLLPSPKSQMLTKFLPFVEKLVRIKKLRIFTREQLSWTHR